MELSDTQNKLSDVQLRNEVDTFLFGVIKFYVTRYTEKKNMTQ